MDDGYKCENCCNFLDFKIFRPIILSCGDSVCAKCLAGILESSKACPTCGKTYTTEQLVECPTNYRILEFISDAHEHNLGKLHILKSKCEEMKPLLQPLKKEIELAQSCEEQIIALNKYNDGCLNDGSVKNKIEKLDAIVDGIRGRITLPDNSLMKDVSMRCEDFNSVTHLLAVIEEGIQDKGQRFAAVLRIDGVKKFARISMGQTYLFIDSFEEAPRYSVLTICFQELLHMFLRSQPTFQIHGFLYLSSITTWPITLIIGVNDSTSSVGYRFLKLCTGENGVSYTGCQFVQELGISLKRTDDKIAPVDYVMRVKNLVCDFKGLDCFTKHFLRQGTGEENCRQNCFLTCDSNGCLDIIRIKEEDVGELSFSNIVGPVVDFGGDIADELRQAKEPKIDYSGIAINFRVYVKNPIGQR